ncbi:hypothetical protein TCON_2425 [Astathelohania contejeani]|uniref:Uncharacterized protein n=1 Tax=Astathelohania contejeani TaxID=164912 RepID=A0ABQ7HW37_9MICR|nr:hypothetical protein TCON_2425 [Thelohania contejeani]
MIPLLVVMFSNIECSFILNFIKSTDPKLNDIIICPTRWFLLIIGLCLSLVGIRKIKTCSMLLLTLVIDSGIVILYDFVNSYKNTGFMFIEPIHIRNFIEFVDDNKTYVIISILIFSFILSFLIISLIKLFTFISLFFLLTILYREVYHENSLLHLGIEDAYLKICIIMILAISMIALYIAIPRLIFAGVFSLTGGILICYAVEAILEKNWGFAKAVEDFKMDIPIKINAYPLAALNGVICFSFGSQISILLRNTKGKH